MRKVKVSATSHSGGILLHLLLHLFCLFSATNGEQSKRSVEGGGGSGHAPLIASNAKKLLVSG